MCIVPVQIKSKETSISNIFLNSCSQGTFILDKLTNDHGISGRKTSLTIKTINGEITSNSIALEGLEVASISEDDND